MSLGPIDIEREERRERDAFAANGTIPTPSIEVYQEMSAAGLTVSMGGLALSRVELPLKWRAEVDVTDHQRWWLVDERDRRRFTCWWKAAAPFSGEPGHGSVEVAKPEPDGLERWWREIPWKDEIAYRVHCPLCRLNAEYRVDRAALARTRDRAGLLALAVRQTEAEHLRMHRASGCQALAGWRADVTAAVEAVREATMGVPQWREWASDVLEARTVRAACIARSELRRLLLERADGGWGRAAVDEMGALRGVEAELDRLVELVR